jgi:Notch-like protein
MFARYVVEMCVVLLSLLLVNGYPSDKNGKQCLNYCSNDGVCLIMDNKAQCYCLPEWEGERCDLPRINHEMKFKKTNIQLRNSPCTYVPTLCKNGGVCFFDDQEKKLACQCPYPYDGPRCDEYSACYNYCLNDGVCVVDNNKKPRCECKEGFEDDRCNVRKTTTPPTTTTTTTDTTTTDVICSYLPEDFCNTGSCIVNGGLATCQCPNTHTGEQCEIPTGVTQGPGQTNPPINPAFTTPTTRPGMTNPTTRPGLTNQPSGGKRCSDNPCQNNRPCYNNGNSYFCDCGTQFNGINCEYFIQG